VCVFVCACRHLALSEEDEELSRITDIAQVLKQVYNTLTNTASMCHCVCLSVCLSLCVSVCMCAAFNAFG